MNKVVSAGGVIVRDFDGVKKILLVYFRDAYYKQFGTFPKGHVEPGENEEQAALREVQEETGIQGLRIVRKLAVITRLSPELDGTTSIKDIHLFLMAGGTEPVQGGEERDGFMTYHDWFSYDEALAHLSFQEEKEFLKKVWPEL